MGNLDDICFHSETKMTFQFAVRLCIDVTKGKRLFNLLIHHLFYVIRTATEPRASNDEATTSVEVKMVTRLKKLCNTNQYEVTSVCVFSNVLCILLWY